MTGRPQPEGEASREALLKFMRNFQRKHQYMPSIKEMAEETRLPRTAVVWHLEKLRESHAVDYEDGKLARSLRLT